MAENKEQVFPKSEKRLVLEDPRLYITPHGWESYQKHGNKVFLVSVLVFLSIGFLSLFLVNLSTSPKKDMVIVLPYFFIVFALFFLVLLIWSNIDRKDTWHKRLPYDKELYERFSQSLKEMLEKKQYQFSFKDYFGMNTVMDTKAGKKYGMQYIIELPDRPFLKIISALEMYKSRYSKPIYTFRVKICNVRMANLQNARRLANEINYVLRGIDFKLVPMS